MNRASTPWHWQCSRVLPRRLLIVGPQRRLLMWRAIPWAALVAMIMCSLACRDQRSNQPHPSAMGATTIENKGSDTLVNLALAWAEAYMQAHPDIRISVTGGGSGTGIAALINGTVHLANASREMKDEERKYNAIFPA